MCHSAVCPLFPPKFTKLEYYSSPEEISSWRDKGFIEYTHYIFFTFSFSLRFSSRCLRRRYQKFIKDIFRSVISIVSFKSVSIQISRSVISIVSFFFFIRSSSVFFIGVFNFRVFPSDKSIVISISDFVLGLFLSDINLIRFLSLISGFYLWKSWRTLKVFVLSSVKSSFRIWRIYTNWYSDFMLGFERLKNFEKLQRAEVEGIRIDLFNFN